MKEIKLIITGMTCEKCENTITNALNKDGILNKLVSFKTGEATVCFLPEKISKENICNAINQTGTYKVTGEC